MFRSSGAASPARSAGNVILAALGWALLGQFVTVLSRSAVTGAVVGIALAVPVDMTVSDAVEGSERWLPGQVLQAVARGGSSDVTYGTPLLTAAVAMTGCVIVFRHRDVAA